MSKHIWVILFSTVFIFLWGGADSLAQQNPSYQLYVESGGYMDFKIYSLSKYQGGVSYTNWTRLKIVYTDTTAGTQTNKWYLSFKANTDEFVGVIPTETLPLNYVSLYVESLNRENPATSETLYQGPHPLPRSSDGFEPLVKFGDEGVFKLNITYRLDSAVIGHDPDYYNTELIFKMDTVPIP